MSVSFWQILIVVGLVLIIFGPSRIPSLGRSLGQAIRGFKKSLDGEDEGEKSKDSFLSSSEPNKKKSIKLKEEKD